jgi:hypothetical protein
MKQSTLNLAQYKSIAAWKPQLGDIVIWHGLMTHWFGIVNGIRDEELSIVKSGLPFLLLQLDEAQIAKGTVTIPISKIHAAAGKRGTYAAIQNTDGNLPTWFI